MYSGKDVQTTVQGKPVQENLIKGVMLNSLGVMSVCHKRKMYVVHRRSEKLARGLKTFTDVYGRIVDDKFEIVSLKKPKGKGLFSKMFKRA